jgi:hypothetical protein
MNRNNNNLIANVAATYDHPLNLISEEDVARLIKLISPDILTDTHFNNNPANHHVSRPITNVHNPQIDNKKESSCDNVKRDNVSINPNTFVTFYTDDNMCGGTTITMGYGSHRWSSDRRLTMVKTIKMIKLEPSTKLTITLKDNTRYIYNNPYSDRQVIVRFDSFTDNVSDVDVNVFYPKKEPVINTHYLSRVDVLILLIILSMIWAIVDH